MSESKPSGLEKVEESDEDLEDREPERSGGDPGILVMMAVILGRWTFEGRAHEGESRSKASKGYGVSGDALLNLS